MSYERKIAHLEEMHRVFKKQLQDAIDQNCTDVIVQEIKKRKLQVKDEILKFKKLDEEGKEFK